MAWQSGLSSTPLLLLEDGRYWLNRGNISSLIENWLVDHFQSPIDLVPSKAKADPALRPLEISYSEGCVKSISNTGNSWKANVDDAKASNMRV